MTQREFWAELNKIGGWNEVSKLIRRYTKSFIIGEECPITAVANKKAHRKRFRISDVTQAADYLGLNPQFGLDVEFAADNDQQLSKYRGKLEKLLS